MTLYRLWGASPPPPDSSNRIYATGVCVGGGGGGVGVGVVFPLIWVGTGRYGMRNVDPNWEYKYQQFSVYIWWSILLHVPRLCPYQ